jgi:hypothetical protein
MDLQLPYKSPTVIAHSVNLANSFYAATGQQLVDVSLPPAEISRQLFELKAIVLSHDGGDDPIFNYANGQAQKLFEYDWETFLTIPSRLSAETEHRVDRSAMLDEAEKLGFISNYSGVRISASGQRFKISAATVWTVTNLIGQKVGQAATFDQVEYL